MSEKKARPLFWIASYPHSGDLAVRSFLQQAAKIKGYRPNDPASLELINRDVPWDTDVWFYREVIGKDPSELSEPEIAAARPKIHDYLSKKYPGLPFIKTHAVRAEFHDVLSINTKVSGGGIYMIRNPLNLVMAFAHAGKKKPIDAIKLLATSEYRQPTTAQNALEPWGSWSENVQSWTEPSSPHDLVVRFEDLLTDPHGQFKRLADHMRLGLSADELRTASDKAVKAVGFAGKKPSSAPWKEGLSPAEARAVLEVHAQQMVRFGYLTNEALNFAEVDRETVLRSSAALRQLEAANMNVAH
ncbi:sulfotransferase domain-containing protein [Maritalea mediterranea]|uniref:Sulfotransferase domain-containing protein n=1 Tax=Maritalea mediterranea TaxID=2909667 RepID=A0ABS9ECD5_9HYPH|nr:sulfotransferase domain-containing protein [Maritalea mediterranea]MCF4099819.1 sulfotransferase domain-containing protein [Maritalea mediterranea]